MKQTTTITISLILRTFLHMCITGGAYWIVYQFYHLDLTYAISLAFLGGVIKEYRDHIVQTNDTIDSYILKRDIFWTVATIILLFFLYLLRDHTSVLIKIIIGSIFYAILEYADHLVNKSHESKFAHLEYKHYFDIAGRTLGPLVLFPLISRILS